MTRASEIVEQIDLTTAVGRNVRAFLLRVLSGARRRDTDVLELKAFFAADDLGLLTEPPTRDLTQLGREVAELLRPEPWCVVHVGVTWAVQRGKDRICICMLSGEAEHIAALLTADAEREATNYTDGAGS